MAISYNPSKDELFVQFRPVIGKPSKTIDGFKLWWDKEGNICAMDVERYSEVLEDFRRALSTVRLGGLWKGLAFTEEEIKETREALLKKLEERWSCPMLPIPTLLCGT